MPLAHRPAPLAPFRGLSDERLPMPQDLHPAAAPAGDPRSGSPAPDLRELGLVHPGPVHANRPSAELVELALAAREGGLTARGALVAYTGSRTGRSPQDRFIVREPSSEGQIAWGAVNRPLDPAAFDRLLAKTAAYLQGRPLFLTDAYAGADPRHRLTVRV